MEKCDVGGRKDNGRKKWKWDSVEYKKEVNRRGKKNFHSEEKKPTYCGENPQGGTVLHCSVGIGVAMLLCLVLMIQTFC